MPSPHWSSYLHGFTPEKLYLLPENRLPGIELQGGETFEEYGKEKLVPPEKIEPGTQEIMVFDRS